MNNIETVDQLLNRDLNILSMSILEIGTFFSKEKFETRVLRGRLVIATSVRLNVVLGIQLDILIQIDSVKIVAPTNLEWIIGLGSIDISAENQVVAIVNSVGSQIV